MSVRAYKIITQELNDRPTFNLWRDEDLIDFFQREGVLSPLDESGGYLELPVSTIKKALKEVEWMEDDYRKKQFEEDIEGLDDLDSVKYMCY